MNKIMERRKALRVSKRTMAKLLHITVKDYKALELNPDDSNCILCYRACKILEVPFNEI